jgi:5-(aminomethyl)-3-furanmethanol phosphate kinase
MSTPQLHPLRVVKVGGSLYDLPDFGSRLQNWLNTLKDTAVLLVPGGGKLVRSIRRAQEKFGFDDETAHWLAVRALERNGHELAQLVGTGNRPVESRHCANPIGPSGTISILDCYHFLVQDEGVPGCLPHSWSVTSDSIAARAASVGRAAELILLKSIDIPNNLDWEDASRIGYVDACFSKMVRRAPDLRIRAINFRNIA